MGNLLSSLFNYKKEKRVLMVGLDNAGKTTILYNLKLGEIRKTVPTIGFNVEQITYKKLNLTVWDIGGQDKIRPLWKHYFNGVNAVIFVIDITYFWSIYKVSINSCKWNTCCTFVIIISHRYCDSITNFCSYINCIIIRDIHYI